MKTTITPDLMGTFEEKYNPWVFLKSSGELILEYDNYMDEIIQDIPDLSDEEPIHELNVFNLKWLLRMIELYNRISKDYTDYQGLMSTPAYSKMQVYLSGAFLNIAESMKTNPAPWIFISCLILALVICKGINMIKWNFIGFNSGFFGNLFMLFLMLFVVTFIKNFIKSIRENKKGYKQFYEDRILNAEEHLNTIEALNNDRNVVKEMIGVLSEEQKLSEKYYPDVKQLWHYFYTGQVDTLKDAINLLEDAYFQKQIEQIGK